MWMGDSGMIPGIGEMFLHKLKNDMKKNDGDLEAEEEEEEGPPSAWLVAPYFFLYFSMFIINSTVWPVLLLERACVETRPQNEAFSLIQPDGLHERATNSCITKYITATHQNDTDVAAVYSMTLYPMIAVTFVSGAVSILSYVLIWKPMLMSCRGVSLFVPPLLMLFQSVLIVYSQSVQGFDMYKYTLLSGVLLPSLHGGFQGVFLLFFHMSESPKLKTKRELLNTKLDGSHATIFLAMLFAGILLSGSFDSTFRFLSFFQFVLAAVNVLYGLALLPSNNSLMSGNENEKNDKRNDKRNDDSDDDDDSSGSSEDEFLLAEAMKQRKHEGGTWWKHVNLLKEAPMIFTETTYQMELIVVIEVCVFTVAMLADTNISVFYFMESPFSLDMHVFGLLLATQGAVKIIGMVIAKSAIYFTQIKHGTLIGLALLNYVIYYTMLSFASTKFLIVGVMFTNLFGGLAFPTIFSFMKINFRETTQTVLDCSMVLSLAVAMLLDALKLFVYEKTRVVFPGASFAITGSLLVVCGIVIGATYVTTSMKYQRKSKHFADKLLNSEQ